MIHQSADTDSRISIRESALDTVNATNDQNIDYCIEEHRNKNFDIKIEKTKKKLKIIDTDKKKSIMKMKEEKQSSLNLKIAYLKSENKVKIFKTKVFDRTHERNI